jgi:Predicted S-adenosylmethionine-dependent methyltransferase
MKKQRLNEWEKNIYEDYHNRQFATPYRSTVKFCDWLEQIGALSNQASYKIMDIGTGKGANLYYMNKRFPNCQYLGIDINNDLIKEGNSFFKKRDINNCFLEKGDLYNLDSVKYANMYTGIVLYQTLSWLPEYKTALNEIIKLNSNWIALTSLFYDGLVDCKIEVEEYTSAQDKKPIKSSFYNIYSIPRIKNYFIEKGFKTFNYIQFEIDIDLPKTENTRMQTFTLNLANNKRVQLSGPLLMNWYFIYAAM